MRGHKGISSNFIAMLCLVFSVAIYTPLNTGMFPNYPIETQEVGQLGILLAILLLSLSHADRTRQLRAQAERTEANSKAAHDFLTTMSHELRTPMHTVLGANECIRSRALLRFRALQPIEWKSNGDGFSSQSLSANTAHKFDRIDLHALSRFNHGQNHRTKPITL